MLLPIRDHQCEDDYTLQTSLIFLRYSDILDIYNLYCAKKHFRNTVVPRQWGISMVSCWGGGGSMVFVMTLLQTLCPIHCDIVSWLHQLGSMLHSFIAFIIVI